MLLTDFIFDNAKRYPKTKALAIKPRYRTITWTYGDLFRFAQGIAGLLDEKGVKKGDRVILWALNSPYWIGAFFGCLLRGAIVVPLHTENTAEFIQNVCDQTQPKVFFKPSDLPEGPDPDGRVGSIDIDNIDLATLPEGSDPSGREIDENDIVEILYTSGTTGEPKGVVLTHKNLVSNLQSFWDIIPIQRNDRVLSILPLSHIFEQMVEFRVLAAGAFIVYAPALSSSLIKKTLKDHRVTKMAAVPEFLKRVITRIEGEAERKGKARFLSFLFDLGRLIPLRFVRRLLFFHIHGQFGGKLGLLVSGGAALDARVAQRWDALGVKIIQGYGLTETSAVVSVLSPGDTHIDSVGKVIREVEVKIADDKEILVRGPNVTKGYWNNAAKIKESLTSDGWFRTGDLGFLDNAGYLSIRGRKKFMILTASGQNVYPEDIEAELNKEPEVKDSAVVELAKDGNVVIHAVLLLTVKNRIPHGGIDPESDVAGEVINKANKRLASFQQIQSWSVWPFEDFPHTITRKVKRHEVLRYLQKQEVPAEMRTKQEVSSLVRIVAQALGKSAASIRADTPLAGQGLDSLARIELVARIEEDLGVEVDEAEISQETTIQDLEKLIEEHPQIAVRYELRSWPRYELTRKVRELLYWTLVLPLGKLIMDLKIEGRENLENLKGPALFIPNHVSNLDGAVVTLALDGSIRRRVAVAAAADTLFEMYRFVQPLVTLLFNTYPFDRKRQVRGSLAHTGELIDKGWSILLFPEGRIPEPGAAVVVKEGGGVLGVEMQVPVVPVKIEGTSAILPHHVHFPRRRGKVTVKFGKPIRFAKETRYAEATKRIQQEMRRL